MTRIQFAVLVAMVGVLIVVESVPLLVGPKASTAERPKYEYRIAGFKDGVVADSLATAGAEGWDLAFARRALDSGEGIYEVILKRPITAGAPPARQTPAPTQAARPTSLVMEPEPPKENPTQAAMAKMTAFKDQMCTCKDAECAKKVSDEMTAWSQEQAQTHHNIRMTNADQERATELGTQMGECMQKAMGMK